MFAVVCSLIRGVQTYLAVEKATRCCSTTETTGNHLIGLPPLQCKYAVC